MTEVLEPPVSQLADALDDVRRSAQQILADVGRQPQALRIRAGDVVVELEWPGQHPGIPVPASTVEPATPVPVTTAAQTSPAEPVSGLLDIRSPTVGTFYHAPEPGAAPFVKEGDQVKQGQQIGIVEAMKLMIPVNSDYDGQVVGVLVPDSTPVEYDDRLFTLAPFAAS